MTRQPWFAVRVTITMAETGEQFTRDYVRGETRMGRDRFAAWAVGDMMILVTYNQPAVFAVHEVTFPMVQENRRYQHTSHNEAGVAQ